MMAPFEKPYQKFYILIFIFISFISGVFLISEIKRSEIEIQGIFLAQSFDNLYLKTKQKPLTIILVGDIMLNRGVEYMVEKEGKGDFNFPFLEIADFLKEADILFGNLEGPISDKGQKVGSIYSFRSDQRAVEGLVFAGFNILSVANNHIFDYGRIAMEDTFNRLKEAGIDYLGGGFNEIEAFSPKIKEIRGTKIAFLAYTNLGLKYWKAEGKNSGISWLEKGKMEKAVKEAKEKSDLVIVSFHYGEEYWTKPTRFQILISQAAIDAGADLIVGHHPHTVQPIERYKEGYIAYSLGNFIFDQSFSKETMEGLMLKVLVKNKEIKEVIPIEIKINDFFQPEILEK